ncbi:MAG: GNAT family N-acetyltransferase [Bifidobacteriaceae bacterium]|nr:GNAT family N-acetyltransferase [Bifidobacteriaceae bacterium]
MSFPAAVGEVWALERPGARRLGQALRSEHLQTVIWAGGSVMPVGLAESAAVFAALALERGGRYTSLVGDAVAVADLWRGLETAWPAPRAYRANQPLLALTTPVPPASAGPVQTALRTATPDLLNLLEPACRAMFTEELGFPPPGPQAAYRAHVANQIERQALLAWIDPAGREVIFKAELGATCGPWVQVQGVWTNPAYRGQGIAKAGMIALINHASQRGLTHVCLYVNDFNLPALAVYRAVGFHQVGTWATIML